MRHLLTFALALLLVSPLLADDKDQALKHAVEQKDMAAVKAAIAAGANVNASDEYGQGVLMYANDPDIARALVAAGAKIDAVNKYGMNALAAAAATGNAPLVKALIESKANVNFLDPNGGIMLENAIASKNVAIIKMMLDAGAKIPAKKKQDIIDEASMSESDEVRALIGSVVGKKIAAKAPPAPPPAAAPKPIDAKAAYDLAAPIAKKWQSDAALFSLTALGDFGDDGRAAEWAIDFFSPSASQINQISIRNGEATPFAHPSSELTDLVTVTSKTILDSKKLTEIANAAGGSRYKHPSVALIHNPKAGDAWYFNYDDPDTQRNALTIIISADTGKVVFKDQK